MRILLPLMLLLVATSAAQAGDLTVGGISERLLSDLLAPVAHQADEAGFAPRIVLQAADYEEEELEKSVVGYFLDHGFQVWVLDDEDPRPDEGVLRLDFHLEAASIAYPQYDDGTLGLGTRRVLRRASAAMTGQLDDPATGQRLWQGSPEARYEDWVDASEKDALEFDRPQWLVSNDAAMDVPKAGWKEKAGVLGLLGGVIILYFSGVN